MPLPSFIRDDQREQRSVDKLKNKDEKKITLQVQQSNIKLFQQSFEKHPKHIKQPIRQDHTRNQGMR